MARRQIVIMQYKYKTYLLETTGRLFRVAFKDLIQNKLYSVAAQRAFDKIFETRGAEVFQGTAVYYF
jgi:hypothetical protein